MLAQFKVKYYVVNEHDGKRAEEHMHNQQFRYNKTSLNIVLLKILSAKSRTFVKD